MKWVFKRYPQSNVVIVICAHTHQKIILSLYAELPRPQHFHQLDSAQLTIHNKFMNVSAAVHQHFHSKFSLNQVHTFFSFSLSQRIDYMVNNLVVVVVVVCGDVHFSSNFRVMANREKIFFSSTDRPTDWPSEQPSRHQTTNALKLPNLQLGQSECES